MNKVKEIQDFSLKLLFTICGIIRSYDVIFITLASKALHMQGVYLKWATSVIHEIIVRQIRGKTYFRLITPHFGIISTMAVAIQLK